MEVSTPNPDPLTSGSSKEEVTFPDAGDLGDVQPPFEIGPFSSEESMTLLFGDEQLQTTFPGLQLTDDLYIAATKDSAVEVFPVKPLSVTCNRLIRETESNPFIRYLGSTP